MTRSLREQITRKVNSYIPLTEKDVSSKALIDELIQIIGKYFEDAINTLLESETK